MDEEENGSDVSRVPSAASAGNGVSIKSKTAAFAARHVHAHTAPATVAVAAAFGEGGEQSSSMGAGPAVESEVRSTTNPGSSGTDLRTSGGRRQRFPALW